ncbi:NAD(P)/FAD-dependent oxidoreductase [Stutzerimonas azotifigens]|uniref:NAD(P)/FAD-dependent oxidoreductase n=1 Tax=Stutzerimonas azotifigens TaxID=291995 RepID=UPI000422FC22|nr:FAD/NAD(P)-binding oxidoreductase [Stutzerimonas azotifigens]
MSERYDLLIVGAGPAGLAAALAAADSGLAIALIDDNPAPGGQIWRDGPGVRLPARARRQREALARHANITLLSGTRVVACADDRRLLVEDADSGRLIGYRKLLLCTGARELLLPFPGWTLPGVTGAGGLQALIKGGLPVRGERVVIAGSGPLLLASAATAQKAGAQVLRVAEQASHAAVAGFAARLLQWPGKAVQALGLHQPGYRCNARVVAALGSERLEAVLIQRGGRREELPCERLACGFGLVPNTQLGEALGCEVRAGALAVDDLQRTRLAEVFAAGECTGFGGSELSLVEGAIAGHAAVGQTARAEALLPERARWRRFARQLARSFALDPALKDLPRPDTLVCRCEDVPYSALAGHDGWVGAKLASRCGMGACQGRVCGAVAGYLFGWTPTRPRLPLSPARVDTLLCLEETALPSATGEPVE